MEILRWLLVGLVFGENLFNVQSLMLLQRKYMKMHILNGTVAWGKCRTMQMEDAKKCGWRVTKMN